MRQLDEELSERVDRVLAAPTENFVELVEVAGFSAAKDFRNTLLRRVDFGGSDLAGFDFSGTVFSECRFEDCSLAGAILTNTRFIKCSGPEIPETEQRFSALQETSRLPAADGQTSYRLNAAVPEAYPAHSGGFVGPEPKVVIEQEFEAEPDGEADTETIEISGLEPGDYFATRVRGISMNRIAPDGALVIVNRDDRELVPGRRYLFNHRGRTIFKRFGGTNPTRFEAESTEPVETIYPESDYDWSVIGRVRMVILDT